LTSGKDIGKYSTSLLSTSHSAPSAVTSLKNTASTHLKTQPLGKTSRSFVKPRLDTLSVQKHGHRQGAAGRDDTDGVAAPHYELKLETARNDEEDEVETFLPPELDPSIHEPALPSINVVQVRNEGDSCKPTKFNTYETYLWKQVLTITHLNATTKTFLSLKVSSNHIIIHFD